MQAFKPRIAATLLMVLCLLPAQQVQAELIATNETRFVSLIPLRNGLSAITLVWPVDPKTQGRVTALKAGLASVVAGGTSSRSPSDIDAFLRIKGVEQNISTNGRDILLTVSAPDDVFPETLVHLENLLLESNYSRGWYERELQAVSPKISSTTGRPSDILNEVAHFLAYAQDDETDAGNGDEFRFGRPAQIILRSGDKEVERRAIRLFNKLPTAKWKLSLGKWAAVLTGADERPFSLPAGIIHLADPSSTEMLILFVKAEEFKDEDDQIGANLLMDYIGGKQGSEMFRIVRQEMRAAYDPHSDFIVMDKNRSFMSLSATVEAERWPEIHGKITEIYEDARAGKIDRAGLEIQLDLLRKTYSSLLFSNPSWGAQHYLNEYPEGVKGTIELPIFDALETASPDRIIADSEAHLPPLDDFLLILIGGGVAPAETLKSKGYCALPKHTPLGTCLDVLSNTLN